MRLEVCLPDALKVFTLHLEGRMGLRVFGWVVSRPWSHFFMIKRSVTHSRQTAFYLAFPDTFANFTGEHGFSFFLVRKVASCDTCPVRSHSAPEGSADLTFLVLIPFFRKERRGRDFPPWRCLGPSSLQRPLSCWTGHGESDHSH